MNLYDVQPTVNDDYDYLIGAGHMVSLYLTTALSEEMVLQEGTYTVSDTGTPGTAGAAWPASWRSTGSGDSPCASSSEARKR